MDSWLVKRYERKRIKSKNTEIYNDVIGRSLANDRELKSVSRTSKMNRMSHGLPFFPNLLELSKNCILQWNIDYDRMDGNYGD